MQESYRYWAFISYSHHDRGWARWLHRRLESYRVPRRLVGRTHAAGEVPRRLYPIFRDRDELPSSADLGGVVQQALRESRYLIVICSARSARSRWVNEEVESFKKLGREERILCLRIDDDTAFAPALLQHFDANGQPSGRWIEPLAADATPAADGRDGAALKLVAGLIGVGYDELRRRERRRSLLRQAVYATATAALVAACAFGWQWQQGEKRAALAAQALRVRIDRFYDAGRSELLAHNEARAAVYLNEVRRLGIDTPALRYMLARALQIVDAQQLRIDMGQTVVRTDISPDGRQVFGIGTDRVLHAYDAASGAPQFSIDLGAMPTFDAGYGHGGRVIWVDYRLADDKHRLLRLFAANDGRLLARFAVNADTDGVGINPLNDDETQVATVTPDGAVRLAELGGDTRRIAGVFAKTAFCHDGRSLLTARADGVIELRDAASTAVRHRYDGLHGRPTTLASTPGCTLIAAGTADGEVRVWDAASGRVRMSSGHRAHISSLVFSNDGTRMLSVSPVAAGVWDMRSGALIYAVRLRGGSNGFQMHADGGEVGQLLGGRLVISDVVSGEVLYTLDGHQGSPNMFAFSEQGDELVSGGSDGALLIWKLPQRPHAQLGGVAPPLAPPTAISRDSRQLFAGTQSGGTLYAREPLRPVHRFGAELGPLASASFSADGQWIAMGARDGRIDVARTDGQEPVLHLSRPVRATALHFDPGARHLSADLADDGIAAWDLTRGDESLSLPAGSAHITAMSPTAPLLAVGFHDGVVRARDLAAGRWRWSTTLPIDRDSDRMITVLSFSADGRRLLATAKRAQAFVLDVDSGRILYQTRDPASAYFIYGALNADGSKALLSDWANLAYLWWPGSGHWLTLSGHTSPVETVSLTPDASLALTGSEDGAIRLWDAENGELLDAFSAHQALIQWGAAMFTPDGSAVLSSGRDGAARLWPLPRLTRDVAAVARDLRCRAPWRISGDSLTPSSTDPHACVAEHPERAIKNGD
ncbi:toll/interleukin-1 receptor domain-containing protein [Solimonas marina]|uniref:TIR domain-containing protein n=1 Tax=Solimonas marina TaxID=2714601 RepID=A0A970B9R7_9GAMM|nr:TIR domain-containing protein [Solimonas marina]